MNKMLIFRLLLFGFIFLLVLSMNPSTTIETPSLVSGFNVDIMNPFNRDYRITEVIIDIDNSNPTMTNVKESIRFKLKGCFKEIYRDTKGTYSIGVRLVSQNAYCEPECEYVNQNGELIGRYDQICDANPILYTELSYSNVIVPVGDAYEFHYTLWGGNWERRAQVLEGTIILPVDTNEVDVYFRPSNSNVEYDLQNNIITFKTDYVKGPYEIIVGFGRGNNIGLEGREQIRNKEENYKNRINSELQKANTILMLALILIIIAPFAVFLTFGREPERKKISFSREVPKDLKPYQVNLLSSGQTGELTPDAMSSTILDLARRGHIIIDEVRDIKGKPKKDVYMTFKGNENDKLSKPEQMVYNFFSKAALSASENTNNIMSSRAAGIIILVVLGFFFANFFFGFLFMISFMVYGLTQSSFITGLATILFIVVSVYFAYRFGKSILEKYDNTPSILQLRQSGQVKWSEIASRLRMDTALNMELRKMELSLRKEVREELGISNYFDSKGSIIAASLLVLGIIASVWSAYSFSNIISFRPAEFDYIIPLFIILAVIAFILLVLPNRVFGRFTKKGLDAHNRIIAFKTFITDYSSLKRYPPSSIAIWDEIIVYATALGCASNVEKHMTKLVGKDNSSSISRAASIGMASSISSSVRSSSSSGGGRGGGRAGGGGGGAR